MNQGSVFLRGAMCAAALVFTACGDPADEEKAEQKCPTVEGDRHLAEGTSTPGDIGVMVHVVGRECLVSGENRLHLYEVGGGDAPATGHNGLHPMSMTKMDRLTVESVDAMMPSMGHGTAQDPVLYGGGAFGVAFQMPGEWRLNVTFASTETTTVQAATFTVTVQ